MRAEVDRSKAVLLNVPVEDVYSALQAQFGSLQVSQFNQYSRVWNVYIQSDAPYRRSPDDITRLYTRSDNGKMVPLSAVVTTSYVSGPDLVPHFNSFPAAQVTGSAAEGYSSGDAIKPHLLAEPGQPLSASSSMHNPEPFHTGSCQDCPLILHDALK